MKCYKNYWAYSRYFDKHTEKGRVFDCKQGSRKRLGSPKNGNPRLQKKIHFHRYIYMKFKYDFFLHRVPATYRTLALEAVSVAHKICNYQNVHYNTCTFFLPIIHIIISSQQKDWLFVQKCV